MRENKTELESEKSQKFVNEKVHTHTYIFTPTMYLSNKLFVKQQYKKKKLTRCIKKKKT